VAYSLKARTVESQQPAVTRQQCINNKGTVFSAQSVLRCYKQDKLAGAVRELLGFSHCEFLLLEAGDSSEIQRKRNIHHWKLLPSNSSEGVTGDTSVCNSEL
jgi:hypothetical protein